MNHVVKKITLGLMALGLFTSVNTFQPVHHSAIVVNAKRHRIHHRRYRARRRRRSHRRGKASIGTAYHYARSHGLRANWGAFKRGYNDYRRGKLRYHGTFGIDVRTPYKKMYFAGNFYGQYKNDRYNLTSYYNYMDMVGRIHQNSWISSNVESQDQF